MSAAPVSTEAYGLAASRGCEHAPIGHRGVDYRAVMEAHGPEVVAAVLASGERAGMLCDRTDPTHGDHNLALLDIVDEHGDVMDDRCIPTAEAWEWWRRAIDLRAVASDCPVCEPAIYAATYGLTQ